MFKNKNHLLLGLTIIISSCGLHSVNYEPEVEESLTRNDIYSQSLSTDEKQQKIDFKEYFNKQWWIDFSDEKLNHLISEGLDKNFTVQEGLRRIRQASYMRSATGADRLPQLNARGTFQDVDGGFGIQGPYTEGAITLSWELDLFNRIGYQRTSLVYLEKAAEEDFTALRLSLSSEIALTYFRIIELNNRLSLLDQQIKVGNDYLNVIKLRFKEGYSSRVDVLQQESQLLNLKSQIPRAREELRIQQNQLDILVGQTPDGNERDVAKTLVNYNFDYSIGVPSDLILSRPDLRASQARVVSFDSSIGAAFADRFPRFSITGNLINRDVPVYGGVIQNFTGGVVLPLIDFGKRRATVQANVADFEASLQQFNFAYINAVGEVENLLFQLTQRKELIHTLSLRREVLDDTLTQATKRYKRGITDYLPVLNAIEALNETEILVLSEKRALIELQIGLHKAIGGNTYLQKSDLEKLKEN